MKNEEITVAPILITLSQLYFKGVEDELFIEVWEELLADDSAKIFLAYCKDKTYLPEEFIAVLGRWLWVRLKKDLIKFNYSSEEIDSTFAFSIGEAIEELWKNKEERKEQIVGQMKIEGVQRRRDSMCMMKNFPYVRDLVWEDTKWLGRKRIK